MGQEISRPILFSGPMVRALLDGRKTQTRRVVTPQPPSNNFTVGHDARTVIDRNGEAQPGKEFFGIVHTDGEWSRTCPYGEPGDRLWVRETWRPFFNPSCGESDDAWTWTVKYAAGGDDFTTDDIGGDWSCPKQAERGNVPGIHMPRWASRITLAVTSVRVERLQAITEEDAAAEGVTPFPYNPEGDCWEAAPPEKRNRTAFEYLWGTINGFGEDDAKRPGCSWDANPWVWVIGFEVHRG